MTVAGVGFTTLSFYKVASFILNTGAQGDSVTVNRPGLVASGLKNFTVNSGAGNDTLTVNSNFALPVPGGSFTYNAGTETTPSGDNLVVNATGISMGAFNPDGGTADNGIFTEDGTDLFATSLVVRH